MTRKSRKPYQPYTRPRLGPFHVSSPPSGLCALHTTRRPYCPIVIHSARAQDRDRDSLPRSQRARTHAALHCAELPLLHTHPLPPLVACFPPRAACPRQCRRPAPPPASRYMIPPLSTAIPCPIITAPPEQCPSKAPATRCLRPCLLPGTWTSATMLAGNGVTPILQTTRALVAIALLPSSLARAC